MGIAHDDEGVAMSAILIPVKDSAEVIEVQVEELPDDADELVSILAQEVAPLDTWLRVAIEYYKQGRSEQFKKILEPLTELDEGFFAEAYGQTGWKAHFIAVLNSLAAFYMAQATREREKAKRKAAFEQATSTYAMAEKEALKSNTPDIMYQTFTGQAQLTLTKGDVAKAVEMWGAITGPASTSVASTLGRACAQFQLGKPEEALKLYVELFKANPSPPPAVRLGLAFSGAKLAKPLLARKALLRTLELDPENVDALVGARARPAAAHARPLRARPPERSPHASQASPCSSSMTRTCPRASSCSSARTSSTRRTRCAPPARAGGG